MRKAKVFFCCLFLSFWHIFAVGQIVGKNWYDEITGNTLSIKDEAIYGLLDSICNRWGRIPHDTLPSYAEVSYSHAEKSWHIAIGQSDMTGFTNLCVANLVPELIYGCLEYKGRMFVVFNENAISDHVECYFDKTSESRQILPDYSTVIDDMQHYSFIKGLELDGEGWWMQGNEPQKTEKAVYAYHCIRKGQEWKCSDSE